jgi:hypothetical protein
MSNLQDLIDKANGKKTLNEVQYALVSPVAAEHKEFPFPMSKESFRQYKKMLRRAEREAAQQGSDK